MDCHHRGSPLPAGETKPYQVYTVFEDITERKGAEEAQRESEARFRLALKNAPVSVAAQDRDLRYVWTYNQKSAKPDEIIGHFDYEIFPAEEAARITAIKRRVLEGGTELREQMWLDRPAGRMYLDICWEPIRDQAGQVGRRGVRDRGFDACQAGRREPTPFGREIRQGIRHRPGRPGYYAPR